MNKIFVGFLGLVLCGFWWCLAVPKVLAANEDEASSKEAVLAVLKKQNDAWNEGDLDTFMSGYLHSPDISYTSGGKEVWGYDALRARYQNTYGDNKSSMGKLSFSDTRVFDLGAKNALCIGHWHLVTGKNENLNGTFTLVLVRNKDGWKIIHDHTSRLPQS